VQDGTFVKIKYFLKSNRSFKNVESVVISKLYIVRNIWNYLKQRTLLFEILSSFHFKIGIFFSRTKIDEF